MRLFLRTSVVALALALPTAARAQPRVSGGVAGDIALSPDPRGFGIFVVDLRVPRVARGEFHALLNTDTLQVGLENIALTPELQLNVAARGQVFFGGMLPDYIARGELLRERGFRASYAQLFTSLKWLPANHHAVEFVASARAWFFGQLDGALPPPVNVISFDPRLRYVYWDLTAPTGDLDPSIFHPRFTGFALGLELGMELRPLRGTEPGGFRPPPFRDSVINDRVFLIRQWIRAGVQAHPRVRLQFEQSASWGVDEDDLTRVRVGGMNPYAVQIPGLPWPALLSERHLAGMISLHGQVSSRARHELGVAFAGGAFNDPGRTNDLSRFAFFGGAAIFGDLRFGTWTVHTRVGWALPSPWLDREPHLGAFVSVSKRWY